MPLTQLGLTAQLAWNLSRANPGFQPAKSGVNSANFGLTGLDLGTFGQVASYSFQIASGASQTVDLRSLTNLVLESYALTHVLAILVQPTGGDCTIQPGTLNWFLSGTNPVLTVPDGGVFLLSGPATGPGQAVSSGASTLVLGNTGGGSVTVDLYLVGQQVQYMTGGVTLTGLASSSHA